MESLAEPLREIARRPLKDIRPAQAARVVRRIVDREQLNPRLDVAAFNSAP